VITPVERSRVGPNQHIVVSRDRHVDLGVVEEAGGAVAALHGGLHRPARRATCAIGGNGEDGGFGDGCRRPVPDLA
jgi:hypothetical protein